MKTKKHIIIIEAEVPKNVNPYILYTQMRRAAQDQGIEVMSYSLQERMVDLVRGTEKPGPAQRFKSKSVQRREAIQRGTAQITMHQYVEDGRGDCAHCGWGIMARIHGGSGEPR